MTRVMAETDTRTRILEAALELFRERGFAEATMREIASRAGVASGLAYYYFDSKDAIVLAFYQRAQEEMAAQMEAAQTGKTLKDRLEAMIEARMKYFEPNRRFLGALMSHAANPNSPLSPFGEPSQEIREREFARIQRAIDETGTAVPKDLAARMPKVLWMYQLGLMLFWIYDQSPHQQRTRELVDKSLGLVITLLRLSNVPLLRPARRTVLEIVEILEGVSRPATP
jgi:AcrR family transcriptional regulator